tara:strand:- start:418 stop:789 length:372 start_codon:yes stop_codon:yes gene_type:complete
MHPQGRSAAKDVGHADFLFPRGMPGTGRGRNWWGQRCSKGHKAQPFPAYQAIRRDRAGRGPAKSEQWRNWQISLSEPIAKSANPAKSVSMTSDQIPMIPDLRDGNMPPTPVLNAQKPKAAAKT